MAQPAYKFPRKQDEPSWPAQGEWTYEDYLRLPEDGNRYEVIRGVLYVSPAPSTDHQFSAFELGFRISAFVRENDLGCVYMAPYDVNLPSGIANPVQPDVLFFQKGNEPRKGTGRFDGVPDLIAEVLSPTTYNRDRTTKLEAYEEAGVPEYWLVDPNARTVEVHALQEGKGYVKVIRGGTGDEVWSSVLPGLRVNVSDLFMP
jgi:Uma2 family endonuclease